MTTEELSQFAATFGPLGALVMWLLVEMRKAAAEGKREDPVMTELREINTTLAAFDKRLAVVETILQERKR